MLDSSPALLKMPISVCTPPTTVPAISTMVKNVVPSPATPSFRSSATTPRSPPLVTKSAMAATTVPMIGENRSIWSISALSGSSALAMALTQSVRAAILGEI